MLSFVAGHGVPYVSNDYSASLYLDCSTWKMKSLLSSETSGALCLMTQIESYVKPSAGGGDGHGSN